MEAEDLKLTGISKESKEVSGKHQKSLFWGSIH